MKRCLPILATIVLTACTATPTPTPTATATFTPAASPTVTLTPTATPDPNMPEGATGRNSGGLWLKEVHESGKTVTFEWYEELDMWVEPRVVKGKEIYTIARGEEMYELQNIAPIRIFFAESEDLQDSPIYFAHSGHGPYKTFEDKNINFYSFVETWLFHRVYGANTHDTSLYRDVIGRLSRGTLTIPVTTPEGKSEARLNQGSGCDVIVVPYEEADPTKDSRFIEWNYWSPDIVIRTMTLVRGGKIITVVASKDPIDTLTKKEIRGLVLLAYARVILAEDQSLEYFKSKAFFDGRIQDFVNFAGRGPNMDERYPVMDVVTKP